MEDSYENAAALVCTIRGATGEHLVAFVGSLIGQQYSVSYVCQLAQHALAFGHWCEDGRISFHALEDDDIVRYQRLRSRRRSRCFETRRRVDGQRSNEALHNTAVVDNHRCEAVIRPLFTRANIQMSHCLFSIARLCLVKNNGTAN
jgi:hypothetical protein